MPQAYLHEVVSDLKAYPLLQVLEQGSARRSPYRLRDVQAIARDTGQIDPDYTIEELVAARLLAWRDDRLSLTDLGSRAALLLEALNSGNVRDVFERLSYHDSTLRMYELVREGMTDGFLESLITRPGFGRLYLCSPWISLTQRNKDALITAFVKEERRGVNPELLVITRPRQGTTNRPPEDVAQLRALGATIFLSSTLHTKLYIREPGPKGGDTTAVIGSQNLTTSSYLELGIRINSDTRIVNQLIAYFFDITTSCIEG